MKCIVCDTKMKVPNYKDSLHGDICAFCVAHRPGSIAKKDTTVALTKIPSSNELLDWAHENGILNTIEKIVKPGGKIRYFVVMDDLGRDYFGEVMEMTGSGSTILGAITNLYWTLRKHDYSVPITEGVPELPKEDPADEWTDRPMSSGLHVMRRYGGAQTINVVLGDQGFTCFRASLDKRRLDPWEYEGIGVKWFKVGIPEEKSQG